MTKGKYLTAFWAVLKLTEINTGNSSCVIKVLSQVLIFATEINFPISGPFLIGKETMDSVDRYLMRFFNSALDANVNHYLFCN